MHSPDPAAWGLGVRAVGRKLRKTLSGWGPRERLRGPWEDPSAGSFLE